MEIAQRIIRDSKRKDNFIKKLKALGASDDEIHRNLESETGVNKDVNFTSK